MAENSSGKFGKGVVEGFGKDVRPNFLNGIGGNATADGAKGKKNEAVNSLRGAEGEASKGTQPTEDNLAATREGEENVGGLYSGGKESADKSDGGGKGKGKFKKSGPVAGILLGILGLIILVGGSSASQLFAWVANINNNLNQSSAVLSIRTRYHLRNLLSSKSIGDSNRKIPDALRAKLKVNNIDIVDADGTDGKKVRILVYNEPGGEKIPIVMSDDDLGRIPGSVSDADIGDVTFSERKYTFDTASRELNSFKTSFETATIEMAGRSAGWFSSLTKAFLKRVGGDSPRNKMKRLGDNATKEEVEEALYKNVSEGSGNSDNSKVTKLDEEDDVEISKEDDSLKVGSDATQVASKLKITATKAAIGSSVACAALRAIGAINAVIAGVQIANIVNYTLKILEVSDKTRDGEGGNVINSVADILNTSEKTIAYDVDGNPVELEGATTESDGFNTAFRNKNIVSQDDPGALMMNREYAMKNALRTAGWGDMDGFADVAGSLGTSIAAFQACLGIQAVMGGLDLASDVALIFLTAGIGNAAKAFIKGAVESAIVTGVIAGITATITLLAPMLAQWLAGNLSTVFPGKAGGYALDAGTQFIHSGNLAMMSGMNASREQAIELYGATKEIRDEWIAYDRATLSPFDTTSKYTFMGSIVNSFWPIINSMKRMNPSFVTSSFDLVGSSIADLSGQTVSAASDASDFKLSLYEGDGCPRLADVGVAGSVYCIKYAGAYTGDLKTQSTEEIYERIKDENFDGVDSNGNPKIKSDSKYAQYIVACNANDAQPGEISTVVEGFIEGLYSKASGGTVTGGALISIGSGFVPFSGALDVADAKEQLDNIPWNSQQVCSDPQYKDFSNYSVDQAALEAVGLIPQSSISVFLDEYYEEHPLDNSYEGIIARYSGLTKEEVTDTLALVDYINYIANYDPSERYTFGDDGVEVDDGVLFDNENEMGGSYVGLNEIVYADVRNRSFAV